MGQQLLHIDAVVRKQADTDACTDLQFDVVDGERLADFFDDGHGHLFAGLAIGNMGDDHREFVPATTRHRINLTQYRTDSGGNLLQEPVSHVVSVGVVDGLEVIDIDKQHTQHGGIALGVRDFQREAVVEQQPVGQVGQRWPRLVGQIVSCFK